MKKQILSLLFVFVILVNTSCNGTSKPASAPDTDYSEEYLIELSDEIFRNELSESTFDLHFQVAHPENYGFEYLEPTFGTYYDENELEESDALCDEYINELKLFDYKSLSKNGRLIYDLLMDFLTAAKDLNQYEFYYEALSPTSGFQSLLPVLMVEYAFYDKDDITDYIKLLLDLPRYFYEIGEYQKLKSKEGFFMSDQTVDEIIEQCNDFTKDPENNLLIGCFDAKIDAFHGLEADEATLLKEENRNAVLHYVIPAYKVLTDALESLKGTGRNQGGLAGYEKGREYYERYVQYTTGTDKTIPEMKKALENKLSSVTKQITGLMIVNNSILDEMMTFQFPYTDPIEITEHLIKEITEDFPVLENAEYTVKYVDEALQDYLNPAFYLIPPLDAYSQNYIYINAKPGNDDSTLFSTVAHEGYPGHLYQNVYFLSTEPELIRTLLGPTGYTEGWGLYTEIYSYALAGQDEALAKAMQLNAEYTYCLYALADIGVHYEGWDIEDYMAFWEGYGITDDSIRDMYQYYVTSPGVYLPYLIGYIELTDLRDRAEAALGGAFDIKQFHQFYLDAGPLPFTMLNPMLDTWIAEQKMQ